MQGIHSNWIIVRYDRNSNLKLNVFRGNWLQGQGEIALRTDCFAGCNTKIKNLFGICKQIDHYIFGKEYCIVKAR